MSQHVRPKYWNLRRYSLLSRVCSFNRNVTYTSFVWVIKNIQAVCTWVTFPGKVTPRYRRSVSDHYILSCCDRWRLACGFKFLTWNGVFESATIKSEIDILKDAYVYVIWHVARNLWDIFMFYKTKVIKQHEHCLKNIFMYFLLLPGRYSTKHPKPNLTVVMGKKAETVLEPQSYPVKSAY